MFKILLALWPIWLILLLFLAWKFFLKSKESRAWLRTSHPVLKYMVIAAYGGAVVALVLYALVAPPSEDYAPYRPSMEDIRG